MSERKFDRKIHYGGYFGVETELALGDFAQNGGVVA